MSRQSWNLKEHWPSLRLTLGSSQRRFRYARRPLITTVMKIRILSLFFAAILQAVPLTRLACSTVRAVTPEATIVFRLIIGAVATLGAFDAVSGASTTIYSP